MRSLLALALAGCTTAFDLPDVPIKGGTEEQREEARAELLDFDAWVGEDRVQLSKIEFEPLGGTLGGTYEPKRQIVSVEPSVELHDVRGIIRHELCHALDHTEDLFGRPSEIFDTLGDRLERSPAFTRELDHDDWRREAFAQICEHAPQTASLLTQSCPEDDPLIREAMSWVSEHVWTSFEPPFEAPLGTPVRFEGVAPSGLPWRSASVRATTDPDLVVVIGSDGESTTAIHAERETGALVESEAREIQIPGEDALYRAAPPLTGLMVPFGGGEDPFLVWLYLEVAGASALQDRFLWGNAETGEWMPIGDGCLLGIEEEMDFFYGDSRAWIARVEEGIISWAPVGP